MFLETAPIYKKAPILPVAVQNFFGNTDAFFLVHVLIHLYLKVIPHVASKINYPATESLSNLEEIRKFKTEGRIFMADDKQQFKRKLSAEEAGGKYILVQKRELDFFPKVGQLFKLQVGEKGVKTYVEAVACWCQGPKKPHSHYRINTAPFKDTLNLHWGAKVVIEKISAKTFKLVQG